MSVFLKELSGYHLHWLPPYSTELNPVEHLWDELRKKWFRNKYFASLDAVEDQLADALKFLMEHPDR
jgi:transposase